MRAKAVDALHIVVTGGARGIGAATARLLAADGAKILITDVVDDEGEVLARELGPRVRYSRHDVTRPEDRDAAIAEAEATFGAVDSLFNNAGILAFGSVLDCTHPGPIRTPMTAELSDALAQEQPIARFGDADEVARMARFLFTEATYSTGSEFVIDGGATTGRVVPLPGP